MHKNGQMTYLRGFPGRGSPQSAASWYKRLKMKCFYKTLAR